MTLTRQRIIEGVCIAIVIAVYTLWVTAGTYLETQQSAPPASSDTWTIGNIFLKQTQPDLFITDTYYSDTRYIEFYTPSYLAILKALQPVGGDYMGILVVLQGILLVLYLITMTALFGYIARSPIIGLIAAMLSINMGAVLTSFWGIDNFRSMLPRSVALSLLGAIVLVFWVIVNDRTHARRLWWLLVGVAIGGIAQLHPTTGMGLALITGTITILMWIYTRTMRPMSLVLLITGTIIAAIPIALTVFGGSGGEAAAESFTFEQFASLFQTRISGFPFAYGRLAIIPDGVRIVGLLIWAVVSLVAFVLHQPDSRSPWTALFFGLQILAMSLVSSAGWQMLLVLVIVTGWLWYHKNDAPLTFTMIFSMAVIGVSLVFDTLLYALWSQFELSGLTTVVAEIPRTVRLIVIPMIAIQVIGLREIVIPRWREQSAVQSWADVVLVLALLSITSQPMLVLIAIALYSVRSQAEQWSQELDESGIYAVLWVLSTILVTLMLYLSGVMPFTDTHIAFQILLICVAVMIVTVSLFEGWLMRRGVLLAGFFTAMVVMIGWIGYQPQVLIALMNSQLWSVWTGGIVFAFAVHFLIMRQQDLSRLVVPFALIVTVIAGSDALERIGYLDIVPDEPVEQSYVARLSDWLRTGTDTDSLIYNATFIDASVSAFIRFMSERSMVISRKDWNMVLYSLPQDLPDIAAYEQAVLEMSPEQWLEEAQARDADYLMMPRDTVPETLPESIVPVFTDEPDVILRVNPPQPLSDPVIVINDTLEFRGAFASRNVIAPCRTLAVESWWQVADRSQQSYALSAQLWQMDGTSVVSVDAPVANILTPLWQPDTLYFDTRGITIPCDLEAGTYQIIVDVYDYNGDAVDMIALDNDAPLTYIVVDTIDVRP